MADRGSPRPKISVLYGRRNSAHASSVCRLVSDVGKRLLAHKPPARMRFYNEVGSVSVSGVMLGDFYYASSAREGFIKLGSISAAAETGIR